MKFTTDNLGGFLLLIIGTIITVYGMSFFFLPLLAIITGLLLINQGLLLQGRPPLIFFVRYWFLKFR